MGRLEAQITQELPLLYRVLLSKLSPADTAEVRAITQLVRESFRLTAEELGLRSFPAWSELHLNPFEHLAGARFFPTQVRHWVPVPGDEHSVNPGSSEWDSKSQRFFQYSGASHRLLVELSDPPRVYTRLAGLNRPAGRTPGKRRVVQAFAESAKEQQAWAQCLYESPVFPLDWEKSRLQKKTSIQTIEVGGSR
jgi:hypothetical protein